MIDQRERGERETRLKVQRVSDIAAGARTEAQQLGQLERERIQQEGLTKRTALTVGEREDRLKYEKGKESRQAKYDLLDAQLKNLNNEYDFLLSQYKAETSGFTKNDDIIADLNNRMQANRNLSTQIIRSYGETLGITPPTQSPKQKSKYTRENVIKAKKLLIDSGYTLTNERIKKVLDEGLIK